LPVDNIPVSANTQNLLKKLLTKDHFKRIDWPALFQLLNEEIPVEQHQNNILSPPIDDRLRVSLGNLPDWDFQRERDFKKALSVNTTKDTNMSNTAGSPLIHSSKVNSATTL
jgi:serine/threonine protein kinase